MMTSNDGGEDNTTYSEIFNYIVHDQFPGAYCKKSKHQLKCFQEGCINQFPCQTVKRGCKVKNRKRIDIFCKCSGRRQNDTMCRLQRMVSRRMYAGPYISVDNPKV